MKHPIVNANYFTVQSWMVNELNLRGLSVMLYAIIFGYSQDQETEFWGSLSYLETMTGYSKQSIIASLKKLVDEGLIIRREVSINNIKTARYKVNFKKLNGGQETLPPPEENAESDWSSNFNGGQETLPPGQETLPKNKREIKDINIIYNINKQSSNHNQPSKLIFDSNKENPNTPPQQESTAKDNPFEVFWKAYPKHFDKQKAIQAFKRASLLVSLPTMLDAIEKQSKYRDWCKDNGKFVADWPHPTTWLNGRRWEDETEIPESKTAGLKVFDHSDLCYKAATKLSSSVHKRYTAIPLKTEEELQEWANVFYLCQTQDHHSFEEISAVLKFSQTDTFWRERIRTAQKFRENWDNLFAGYIESERKKQS